MKYISNANMESLLKQELSTEVIVKDYPYVFIKCVAAVKHCI